MRTLIIISFLLIFPISAFGQDFIKYFNQANEAEFQLSESNFSEAESILTKLQTEYNSLKPKDYFYLGIIKYLKNDSINGNIYLSNCAYNYGRPTDHIANYKRMYPQLNISDASINKFSLIENERFKAIQKNVTDTLTYFIKQDQLNRSNQTTGSREVDVIIQMAFLNYLKANGIPDLVKYGDGIIGTILLHLKNEEVFSNYKEYLYEELCKGNIYPNLYGSMVDRHQYDYYKPTIYNSYFSENITDSKKLTEISNNRKNIGLSKYFKGPNIRPIPDFINGNLKIINPYE
jgi:hypothetical protein